MKKWSEKENLKEKKDFRNNKMYKFSGAPSSKNDLNELADFVELECLKNTQFSKNETISTVARLEDDNDPSLQKIIDPIESKIEDVFGEIDYRMKFCNGSYPFILKSIGSVLKVNNGSNESAMGLYKFLLLATRLNMQTERFHGNIDGTLLFEKISKHILTNYLGSRTKAFLFGTSSHGTSFESKVNELCKELNEGHGFINRNNLSAGNIKDDALDIVAWKPFTDNYGGKLIAFGQCKTGTTWKTQTTHLRPDSFCKSWMRDMPSVDPIRIYFVCESLLRNKWYTTSAKAGIFFDRCRIMDFCQNIPTELNEEIKIWSDVALDSLR
jgi:hypothetical protein